jgi:hypothetical protein
LFAKPSISTSSIHNVDHLNDTERAERLASFDPTVIALVLASPPISPERRDRLRQIFGAAS